MSRPNPNLMERIKKIEHRLDRIEKRLDRLEKLLKSPSRPPGPSRPGPKRPGPGKPPEPFRF
ncbi:MAG: hypothetical protein R6U96_16235 [Promethearchaeia archaeon]